MPTQIKTFSQSQSSSYSTQDIVNSVDLEVNQFLTKFGNKIVQINPNTSYNSNGYFVYTVTITFKVDKV